MKIDLVEKSFDSKFKGEYSVRTEDEYLFLELYIKKKYSKNLYTLPFTRLVLSNILSKTDRKTRFVIGTRNGGIFIPEEDKKEPLFIEFISKLKNIKKRFTYYQLQQDFIFKNNRIQHSASFIYDKKTNTIDHFDSIPQEYCTSIEKHQKKIMIFFRMVYGKDISINFSRERPCTYFGNVYFQKCNKKEYLYTSKGFCTAWTMWYLEYRLANPDFSSDELIQEALKIFRKSDDKICKFIRGYAQFYTQTIEKYIIIKDSENNKQIIRKI
jgi:hypothetical protein